MGKATCVEAGKDGHGKAKSGWFGQGRYVGARQGTVRRGGVGQGRRVEAR